MLRSFFAVSLFIFLCSVSSIRAQDDPDALVARASRIIDSTMGSINIRAERFNEELAKVNATKPLEIASLAKDKIPKNKEVIKDFLSYLEVYHSLSNKMKEGIEDSVRALRAKMPSQHRAKFLQEFLDAYNMDQGAFDKYILMLTKVFTNITVVLTFVETSNLTINDNKLQFSNKKEVDDYTKLIDAVEKSNKKLINASATSQKARIDASAIMQKAYGSIRK
jgi:hypothetical protein